MKCAACAHENPANSKFCLECGGGFSFRCSQCGSELPAGAKFCNECGRRISPSPSTGEGRGEGDRKEPRDYTPKHLAERILAEQAALQARGAPGDCPEPG